MTPQSRIVAPSASPEEAAAVVAALERFLHDRAPGPAPPSRPALAPWARAGLLEATGHAPGEAPPWGRSHHGR
ncbi:MAG: hypothetical protein QOJ35_1371 [Solirubrobacteraceae bacterium]|jgi:hypothetical protein|nr:hypothetical protein [Solirubrobacteraceae bacterium]